MRVVLLDTSVMIDLIQGEAAVLEIYSEYDRLLFPAVALGELYFGAYNSSKLEEHLTEYIEVQRLATIIPIDVDTAEAYGKIKSVLKVKGQLIPENDLWIAATAAAYGVELITRDKHFLRVDGLDVTVI